METIKLLLSRPNVLSVTVSKDTITVVAKSGTHRYSMEYFEEHILPKLTEGQAQ